MQMDAIGSMFTYVRAPGRLMRWPVATGCFSIWQSRNLNRHAGNIKNCIKVVNGGFTGTEDRLALWQRVKKVI